MSLSKNQQRLALQEQRHLKNTVYLLTGSRSLDNPVLIARCLDESVINTIDGARGNDCRVVYNRFVVYDMCFDILNGSADTRGCLRGAYDLANHLLLTQDCRYCPILNTVFGRMRLNRMLTGFVRRYEDQVLLPQTMVAVNDRLAKFNFPDDMIWEVLGFVLPEKMQPQVIKMLYGSTF